MGSCCLSERPLHKSEICACLGHPRGGKWGVWIRMDKLKGFSHIAHYIPIHKSTYFLIFQNRNWLWRRWREKNGGNKEKNQIRKPTKQPNHIYICIYFPFQYFNSILSICLYCLVGRAYSRVKGLFLVGPIYSSQGHWHCSSVIPLPALCGGISPIARQSLSFLLTEWFLCLGFCASQGARGRCLDSTHLCIAAAPHTHSFHGPRRPSQESTPNGPVGPTRYLIKILILWSCQWKCVRHCEWCVKVTQLCPTLAHIN